MRGNHPGSLSYKLRVAVVDFPQLGRRLDAVLLHHIEKAEDVADAGKRHTFLAREVLDDLHLADVSLRVTAAVGVCAVRLDQLRVLIQHQGTRMRFQDLGCDADRVKGLVEIAERMVIGPQAAVGSCHHLRDFRTWMTAGPSSTTHSTGKMHPTIGKTMRDDAWAARS